MSGLSTFVEQLQTVHSKTSTIHVQNLAKLRPVVPNNCVLVIVGNESISRKEFSAVRNWLYESVGKHIRRQGKVLLLCNGVKDPLRRMSKWKEFSAVPNKPDAYSNFSDNSAFALSDVTRINQDARASWFRSKGVHDDVLDEVSEPIKLQQLWEIGGDHADNAIQAESSKRKRQVPLDEHFDDCGDDVSFLTVDDSESKAFMTYFETPFDDTVASDSEDDNFDGNFLQTFLEGRVESRQRGPSHKTMEEICNYVQTLPKSDVDFIELFGGKAGSTRVGIRRHLRTGINFDLTADIDLSDAKEVNYLFWYLRKHQPLVVLMGPPCTAFGPWSHLNKVVAREAWERSMSVGLPLARLAAKVARHQLMHRRHFLAENPWNSELWHLPEWSIILRDSRIRVAYCDQCQVGLVDKEGVPTKKPTAFVASSEILVKRLRRKCNGEHTHSQIAGSLLGESKSAFAATWPVKLCNLIVDSIIELKSASMAKAYPAVSSEACPGCKQHARRDDIRHIRRGNCKFPNDVGVNWECEGCRKHRHVSSTTHSKEPGKCQWAEAQTRITLSRGGFPRDPRVPNSEPVEEIAIEDDYPEVSPPATPIGEWLPVSTRWLIEELDNIRRMEGWHKLTAGPACVAFDNQFLRTPEPRFELVNYPTRSVFGYFPDLSTMYSNWWQLQDNAPSAVRGHIGYPVAILVHIFHPADNSVPSSPFKEKPDEQAPPLKLQPKPQRSTTPAEAREEGDEEELPQPIIPYAPRSADEDPNEQQVAISPDWSSFDLGKALRNLRSSSTAVIVRQLRILHLRWWHAKSNKMRTILETAGLPKQVLDLIPAVIDTCKVCRLWQRPGRSAITSSRLSLEFNQNVQADLLLSVCSSSYI